jgi:hypothetical protein
LLVLGLFTLLLNFGRVKLVSAFDLVPFYFFLILLEAALFCVFLFCWSPCSYFQAALLLLLVSSWCVSFLVDRWAAVVNLLQWARCGVASCCGVAFILLNYSCASDNTSLACVVCASCVYAATLMHDANLPFYTSRSKLRLSWYLSII